MRGRRRSQRQNYVDAHIGSRVRLRRTLLGLSQERLGVALGLSFQQVQKYERGANRIGASRLYDLSRVLEVPVAYFFEEITPESVETLSNTEPALAEGPAPAYEHDPMMRRETLELVRAYYTLPDAQRRTIYQLVKTMAESHARQATGRVHGSRS